MSTPPPAAMSLMNEMTEVNSRIKDLVANTSGRTVRPAEAVLIRAQAQAMGVYLEMLNARLYLLAGSP
jgi:hypothetical protein